jgi:hypothetical protein
MAKRLVLGVVLTAFAAETALVLGEMGVRGFLEAVNLNNGTRLMFVDLSIALSMALVWMYRDAVVAARRFWPYAALTLMFGSVGPLTYLLVGTFSKRPGLSRGQTAELRGRTA